MGDEQIQAVSDELTAIREKKETAKLSSAQEKQKLDDKLNAVDKDSTDTLARLAELKKSLEDFKTEEKTLNLRERARKMEAGTHTEPDSASKEEGLKKQDEAKVDADEAHQKEEDEKDVPVDKGVAESGEEKDEQIQEPDPESEAKRQKTEEVASKDSTLDQS